MEIKKENLTTSSAETNSSLRIQKANPLPTYQTEMAPNLAGNMAYQVVYPEVFYRLQPYIIMVCDQMDTYGSIMPTQDMVEQLTDGIYDDVCRMYPDMLEYARSYEKNSKAEGPDLEVQNFGMFNRRRRRRGPARDLIDILLISELLRRRRRMNYYYY